MKTLILILIFIYSIPALSKDLFDLTNELRRSLNRPALLEDPDLKAKALGWSKSMHDGFTKDVKGTSVPKSLNASRSLLD